MPTAVQVHDVPEAIRSLSTFDRPDYVDLFVASAEDASGTSTERWARAAMEGAPAIGRFLAWRVCCGLRLDETPLMTTSRGGGSRAGATTGSGWRRPPGS